MFGDERDIKESKNTYLISFLTEVCHKILMGLISSGKSIKLQITDRQLKFQPNHRWVSCN